MDQRKDLRENEDFFVQRNQTSIERRGRASLEPEDQTLVWEMIENLLQNYKFIWESYRSAVETFRSLFQVCLTYFLAH